MNMDITQLTSNYLPLNHLIEHSAKGFLYLPARINYFKDSKKRGELVRTFYSEDIEVSLKGYGVLIKNQQQYTILVANEHYITYNDVLYSIELNEALWLKVYFDYLVK